jgi:hypothetical protein
MLTVTYAEYHIFYYHAECHETAYPYTECHYVEHVIRSYGSVILSILILSVVMLSIVILSHPSLIFVGKAKSLPLEWSSVRGPTMVGSSLACKY